MAIAPFDLDRIGDGLVFIPAPLDDALAHRTAIVVSAPPGTGKTTLVPPLLANRSPGRVIVTQPRRVAARAAAHRLAGLDGSRLGDRVGFTVRGDRATSARTRIEFVTAGVLLRRLLDDPGLDGVDAVVIDEVHERALETDLLVGLLGEVRELRDDLVLIAMSATIDAERLAAVIDPDIAPIVAQTAPAHPLEERWAPSPAPRMDQRGVTREFLDHVARTAASGARSLTDPTADTLVFAPGAREVAEIARRLRDETDFDVRELHGQVADLDAAIRGRAADETPRIIVATSIAESSLTVPGVRLVVDSCLSRHPQRDAARGMSGLVTSPASRASAVQRAGRATRQGPGTVIRCIDERTFAAAPARPTPEIATADLTDAALLLACWGAPGGSGLRLIDPLPPDALLQADDTLRGLGAVDADGRATDAGRELARIPVDPRLARALHDGARVVGSTAASEVVALLGDDVRVPDADITARLAALRGARDPQARRHAQEVARLKRFVPASEARADAGAGPVVALAFPERVARRVDRDADGATFLLASGTRAGLSGPLADEPWLAVADVSRAAGREARGTGAIIRSAAALTEEQAREAAAPLFTDRVEAEFADGRVTARRERRLGAIVLSSVPVRPDPADGAAAVERALHAQGLEVLTWSDAADGLRRRLALLHRELGDPWPAVDDRALLDALEGWFGPELASLAAGTPADRVDLVEPLRRLLPWPAATRFDVLAPERLEVPSGSRVRLAYPPVNDAVARPIVAVKLQECFGWAQTPRIADGRVPVLFHLLSPAGRPVAVTDDLTSFWSGPYAQVRAEMRGRYPKHPWPEDPWSAPPTARTTKRMP